MAILHEPIVLTQVAGFVLLLGAVAFNLRIKGIGLLFAIAKKQFNHGFHNAIECHGHHIFTVQSLHHKVVIEQHLESAPHDWLFPRMTVIVHHGGAGTSAAALRAGVPSVVVPFFGDQPFWAHRLLQLGVSPAPIPKSSLTVDKLAEAIAIAVSDETMRQRVRALGNQIRAENGVQQAVAAFHQCCL